MHEREQISINEKSGIRQILCEMSADVSELQRGTSGDGIKKLIESVEWIIDYSHTCNGCLQMYANRNPPEEAPCITCRVEVEKENKNALDVFFIVQNQYIMGPDSPIAINHLAIHETMKLLKIKDRLGCFKKVMRLADWWIKRIHDKREES